jgi:hypothetical protein
MNSTTGSRIREQQAVAPAWLNSKKQNSDPVNLVYSMITPGFGCPHGEERIKQELTLGTHGKMLKMKKLSIMVQVRADLAAEADSFARSANWLNAVPSYNLFYLQ